jgi:hypothetical protein
MPHDRSDSDREGQSPPSAPDYPPGADAHASMMPVPCHTRQGDSGELRPSPTRA